MLEKPVPPRPFSVWVLPSLTLWARYDSKAAEDPTNIKFIAFFPPASCHWQPLGSLVRFAVGPISARASSTVTIVQIDTACPARLAAVHEALDLVSSGRRTGARAFERHAHIARHLGLELLPILLRQNVGDDMRSKFRQRITGRARRDLRPGAIPLLVVGPAVAREPRHREPDQCGPLAAANMLHDLGQQLLALHRVRAVSVADEQVPEAREVLGDIAARRLHFALHRNAEPVVLDVKQHREFQRGRYRERRPESVRRDRSLAAA